MEITDGTEKVINSHKSNILVEKLESRVFFEPCASMEVN